MVEYLHFNYYISKIITESLLFIVSFAIQKTLVFNSLNGNS
jgi:hypothetical protein